MKSEEYIDRIVKQLKCNAKKKKAIRRELAADIQAALETGEAWTDILNRMGTPAEMAAEFNENFTPADLPQPRKGLKIALITGGVILLLLLIAGLVMKYYYLPRNVDDKSVTTINLATAETVIDLVSKDDVDTLYQKYASAELIKAADKEVILQAKQNLNSDWGNFQKITSHHKQQVKQRGEYYTGFEIVALYDNLSVTYTMYFDKDDKLTGFYMK